MTTDNEKANEEKQPDQAAQPESTAPVPENAAGTDTVAKETPEEARLAKKKKVQKEIISWILTLGAAVVIALLIRTFLFEPIRVDGNSMQDTLQNNEIMFVTKPEYLLGEPQRGDVVICKYPGRTENFVKRLMAVPGDTIEIRDHVVYINGEAVDEAYLTTSRNDDASSADMTLMTLEADQYFVMGDNRDNSHDCRNYYGYGKPATLTRSQIIGHVRYVLFPFNVIRGIE
jgi:signal peptidase I